MLAVTLELHALRVLGPEPDVGGGLDLDEADQSVDTFALIARKLVSGLPPRSSG